MKQLDRFLSKMRKAGWMFGLNWEEKRGKRTIFHYQASYGIQAAVVHVIFYTYGDADGFEMFTQGISNQMDECEVEIRQALEGQKIQDLPLKAELKNLAEKLEGEWKDADADYIRETLKNIIEKQQKKLKTDEVFEN